ncbi:MAG: hypothetical protein ACT4PS_09845 [Betaproteobacteria bacterium]
MKKELITDEQWLALKPKFEKSVKEYQGNAAVLENAWGALLVGTQMGWKVAFIMHNQATIKNYERITGVRFRDVCDPETHLSKKSLGYAIAKGLSSIWKAIRGEEAIRDRMQFAAK